MKPGTLQSIQDDQTIAGLIIRSLQATSDISVWEGEA